MRDVVPIVTFYREVAEGKFKAAGDDRTRKA